MFTPDVAHKVSDIITCICDYCGNQYQTQYRHLINGRKTVNKDACKNCRSKKARDVCLAKHGYESNFNRPDIQNKILNSIQNKYGVNNISMLNCVKEKKRNTYRNKHNGKLLLEWAHDLGKSNSTFGQQVAQYGLETALNITSKQNGLEQKLYDLLPKDIKITRDIRSGKIRPDFILNNKIVIECDGLYWHSDAIIKDKKYHYNKRLEYIRLGFTPLFFREDEIINKPSIVSSIIRNKLGLSNRLYARKCILKQVSKDDGALFFNHNHLMGVGQGKIFGLYHNNNLVSCIQIINKSKHYEISRFCNLINTTVVGGLSKLLKSYCIHKDVVSFVDLRYGSGESLLKNSFILKNTSISFMWTKDMIRLHRMKFPGNSGYDYKYHKIWDCGQARYELLWNKLTASQ